MPENKTKIFTPASPKKASFFEFKIENSNNGGIKNKKIKNEFRW